MGTTVDDTLADLRKLSRSAEAIPLIEAAAERIAPRYQQIRDDHGLSQLAKMQGFAQAYTGAMARLNGQLTSLVSSVTSTDRDDAERVFGVKGLPGDPGSLAISRRDATDRVAAISDPRQLGDLLTRSIRSGDEVLAHAVVERAINGQNLDVVNQFIAARPLLAAATERLWYSSQGQDFGLTFTIAGLLSSVKAPELGKITHWELDGLASGDYNRAPSYLRTSN